MKAYYYLSHRAVSGELIKRFIADRRDGVDTRRKVSDNYSPFGSVMPGETTIPMDEVSVISIKKPTIAIGPESAPVTYSLFTDPLTRNYNTNVFRTLDQVSDLIETMTVDEEVLRTIRALPEVNELRCQHVILRDSDGVAVGYDVSLSLALTLPDNFMLTGVQRNLPHTHHDNVFLASDGKNFDGRVTGDITLYTTNGSGPQRIVNVPNGEERMVVRLAPPSNEGLDQFTAGVRAVHKLMASEVIT